MLIPSTRSNPSPVDRISGLKKSVQDFKPGICTERALIWTGYCKNPQNKNKPASIQIAEAFYDVLLNKSIKIYPNELIVGNFTSKRVGGEILPELLGVPVMEDLFKFSGRKTSPLQISARETWQLLRILPYWLFRFLAMRAYTSPFTKVSKMLNQLKSYFYVMNETGGIAHTIPDHEKLIRVGTDGILAEVFENQKHAAKNSDQRHLLNFADDMKLWQFRWQKLKRMRLPGKIWKKLQIALKVHRKKGPQHFVKPFRWFI